MVAAIGVAFDASRLVTERHTLQSIADAAALAAMVPENISTQERQNLATASVEDYLRQSGEGLDVRLSGFDTGQADERVALTLESQKDLVFGGIIGMSDYTVKASATAVELTGADATAGAAILTSISFVVGYSDSMAQRDGQSSRIQMVKSAISSVLGAENPDTLETSFYPFNWGTVNGNVSPLQPGVASTVQAMQFTSTSEGNVPSDAIERATAEQTTNPLPVEKFVVFITDSAVENEKSDVKNQYLPDNAIVDASSLVCRAVPPELIAEQDEMAHRIDKTMTDENLAVSSWTWGGTYDESQLKHDPTDTIADGFRKRAMLNEMSAELMIRYGNADVTKTHDPEAWQLLDTNWDLSLFGYLTWVQGQRRRFLAQKMQYEDTCEPIQEQRVVEACEVARQDDVTIVGIDLSGDDASGTQIVQECVFGELESDVTEAELFSDTGSDDFPYPDAQFVEGLSATDADKYVAPDGSVYVSVSTEAELQSVLRSIMPETSGTTQSSLRSVRLVR